MDKAVIGGTGVYDLDNKNISREVKTEYGTVKVDIITHYGEEIVFLARHGKNHSRAPHNINYRANIKALEKLGIKYIYATAAVGSFNENYEPGDIVVIKDFIDFTKTRAQSFLDSEAESVKHFDMSDPYCKNMRSKFSQRSLAKQLKIKGNAVYVCTEGPRFETAAEIEMFKKLGGDVVGMTGVPEVILAKELGICYASVAIITNWSTGMKDELDIHEFQELISAKKAKITEAFMHVFLEGLDQNNCSCGDSLIEIG
ncbi:S-methyl-5'-thioinosine phosphorylase [Halanaerobium sp. Z-7514]|uniref:Purine nucleoside phosphorylase n=1 Tax=Halanaerobium polyolivorans TaxID=2886943 RepID=A0AAW4WW35_9FIRM|nr:S-methyl-5'-thioinosine phosphorylase [Halanaerobium polyolivorans]MCC3143963.1 S-methyl-5'-thioinosine phosphorylase [Halanaerobium polyolivorans]RQD74659.1 MAG: S-methyl-5'-thioinosine phosphorylase [Halanaerobium sp. MSAO_Bac5]